jgi:hypothetical protein
MKYTLLITEIKKKEKILYLKSYGYYKDLVFVVERQWEDDKLNDKERSIMKYMGVKTYELL